MLWVRSVTRTSPKKIRFKKQLNSCRFLVGLFWEVFVSGCFLFWKKSGLESLTLFANPTMEVQVVWHDHRTNCANQLEHCIVFTFKKKALEKRSSRGWHKSKVDTIADQQPLLLACLPNKRFKPANKQEKCAKWHMFHVFFLNPSLFSIQGKPLKKKEGKKKADKSRSPSTRSHGDQCKNESFQKPFAKIVDHQKGEGISSRCHGTNLRRSSDSLIRRVCLEQNKWVHIPRNPQRPAK